MAAFVVFKHRGLRPAHYPINLAAFRAGVGDLRVLPPPEALSMEQMVTR